MTLFIPRSNLILKFDTSWILRYFDYRDIPTEFAGRTPSEGGSVNFITTTSHNTMDSVECDLDLKNGETTQLKGDFLTKQI